MIDLKQYGTDYQSFTTTNKVGEYFTPSRICQIIKQTVEHHSPNGLCVYIAQDGVVYRDQVVQLCTSPPFSPQSSKLSHLSKGWTQIGGNFQFSSSSTSRSSWDLTKDLQNSNNKNHNGSSENKEEIKKPWRSVMVLAPLRLGVESLNKLYIPGLKNILQLRQSIGIIGGKPKQSLYFIGYQGEEFFFF